jgi:dephospho-CoA kinase
MYKQLPQSEKVARADFIIQNDGQQSVIRQVVKIHADLLEIFQTKTNQLA